MTENMWNNTLLQSAKNADLMRVQVCLNNGANIEAKNNIGQTALLLAAKHGSNHNLNFLISKNANINVKDTNGENALTLAATFDYPSCVETLLRAGANISDILGFKFENIYNSYKEEYEKSRQYILQKMHDYQQAEINNKQQQTLHDNNRIHIKNLNKRKSVALKRRPIR